MAGWRAALCVAAAMLLTSSAADDVSGDVMLSLDPEEQALQQPAELVWPGNALSDPEIVELTMVHPRSRNLQPSVGSQDPSVGSQDPSVGSQDPSVGSLYPRVGSRWRRSPQDEEETPARGRRRKKGRRRGGRRRGGGKRRRKGRRTTTTDAPTPQTASTTPTPAYSTADTETVVARRGRGRSTAGGATYTVHTTTAAPPTTPPPLPDYNVVAAGTVNQRPVIGVLAQSVPKKLKSLTPDEDAHYINSYIAASYVKLLESAGARVVPVMVDQSEHYYREMYRYLNGLLLPDGEADLEDSSFSSAFKAMWKVAAKHSEDHFPVLGVGQGMEMILRAEGQTNFASCDAENLAATVAVTPGSRLFGRPGGDELSTQLRRSEAAVFFRRRCLTPSGLSTGTLADKFRTIGTSRDHSGRQIVAGVEHQRLPVWGVLFRPEMPLFEWSREEALSSVPRSDTAARLAHHLATTFIAEARLSRHRFPSSELEDDYLIYNYEPEYTGVRGSKYTACYFFA